MREILFRGQHRRYGEQVNMAGEKLPPVWVYGGALQGEGDFSIIYGSKSPDGKFEEKYPVYTETLGQYTGLTDKNGKKIFEGDVVKVKDALNWGTSGTFIGSVGFGDASFRIETDTSTHYRWQDYDCEVIGNIHDNPELLEEAT